MRRWCTAAGTAAALAMAGCSSDHPAAVGQLSSPTATVAGVDTPTPTPTAVDPGPTSPVTVPPVTVTTQPVASPVAPPPPLAFLNRLQGDWNLQSWTEATGPTTLYLDVRGGTMTVGGSGATDWRLNFDERGESHNPQPAIKCGGQASDAATITGQPGGDRNSSIDWTADLESVDHSSTGEGFIWRAMCGWTTLGGQYPFAVTLQGDPTQPATVMQMSNQYGTFVWHR